MSGYNDDLVMSYMGLWIRETALRLREGIELQKKDNE